MASDRISIRIAPDLRQRIEEAASATGKPESDVVREALKQYFADRGNRDSCYEAARRAGVVGVVKKAPSDLSTNQKYLEGFGRK
jgi:predicted DNA-binding protein